ncbi:MAG TPA: hypothetical protein VND41_00575 [Nitrososphaerales archaeon]|nr:hypothetical protein [Nitrososphaerales archaeon]
MIERVELWPAVSEVGVAEMIGALRAGLSILKLVDPALGASSEVERPGGRYCAVTLYEPGRAPVGLNEIEHWASFVEPGVLDRAQKLLSTLSDV